MRFRSIEGVYGQTWYRWIGDIGTHHLPDVVTLATGADFHSIVAKVTVLVKSWRFYPFSMENIFVYNSKTEKDNVSLSTALDAHLIKVYPGNKTLITQ